MLGAHLLAGRKLELIRLLDEEQIDIIFLTETDTKSLEKEGNYCVKGYETIFPERINFMIKVYIMDGGT